jgi:hypothetical protein
MKGMTHLRICSERRSLCERSRIDVQWNGIFAALPSFPLAPLFLGPVMYTTIFFGALFLIIPVYFFMYLQDLSTGTF